MCYHLSESIPYGFTSCECSHQRACCESQQEMKSSTLSLLISVIIQFVWFCRCQQNLRGSERAHIERQSLRKHAIPKPKLHYSTSLAHVANKYGVELPSFAFDYSEFISGAVIERSNHDLFLTMFLVGHEAVSTDFPFHAISTDEEVMHSWSRAVNKWDSSKAKSTPVHSHSAHSSGLSCVVRNNAGYNAPVYQTNAYWVHSQHEADPTSANSAFSMLRCRLRHANMILANVTSSDRELFVDLMRSNPHKRASSSSSSSSSSLQQHHRNTTLSPTSSTSSSSSSKGSSKSSSAPASVTVSKGMINSGRRATSTTFTTASTSSTSSASSISSSSDVKIASDARGTVLCSFSVPWATRVVGYPVQHASALDMWAEINNAGAFIRSTTPGTTLSQQASSPPPAAPAAALSRQQEQQEEQEQEQQKFVYPHTPPNHSTFLCVPDVRPLHPQRAEVGLPMLLEFIEHHLQLGFAHIALGLVLDWHSPYMTKHLHVLRQFIQHGRVSLHATALPGFDDVPGFAGVQLNDAYAQQFFLNQCLYLAKNMAAYVTVLRPGEFLVPRTSSQETNGEGVARAERSVVSQLLVQFEKASANVSTGARGSALHPSPSTPTTNTASSATAHCSFVLRAGSIPSSTAHSSSVAAPGPAPGPAGVIAGPLEVYGIEDPPSVFGGWGPGESSWSKDFFASSAPRLLLPDVTYALHFFPTNRVLRLEVGTAGQVQGYCKYSHAASRGPSSSGSSGSGSGSSSRGVSYTAQGALAVDSSLAALFVYKGAFPPSAFAPGASVPAPALKEFSASQKDLAVRVSARLQNKGLGSIKAVKAQVKEAAAVHASGAALRASERLLHQQQGDLAHHVASTAKSAAAAAAGRGGSAGGSAGGSVGGSVAGPTQQVVEVEVLPGRADVKAPFWQLCNTDRLRDVIRRVFHAA